MRIGDLVKYIPSYPSIYGNGPLDKEKIVLLVDRDGVGFRSEVLVDDKKFWVKNSLLYDLTDKDIENEI